MPHGNAYLAQHPAGGDPRYADLFGKPHSGNTTLVRCSQINCPEPLGQGEVGGMKQRPSRERRLVMTLGAFVTVARGDGIATIMSTSRTTESFRLALLHQRLSAGFFRSIPFLPVRQVYFRRIHGSTLYLAYYEGWASRTKKDSKT